MLTTFWRKQPRRFETAANSAREHTWYEYAAAFLWLELVSHTWLALDKIKAPIYTKNLRNSLEEGDKREKGPHIRVSNAVRLVRDTFFN
jgi:hypothetical protein